MIKDAVITDLLVEIARCPVVQCCLSDLTTNDACSQIVRSQNPASLDEFQVPEPWSGDLENAPILFIGSNPSISMTERYPRWRWSDDLIADFFTHRFGGGAEEWVTDGKYSLAQDGTRSRDWVRFWAAIRRRAAELLATDPTNVRPGIDYAISEVVHCKSRNQVGVQSAFHPCVKRYLNRIVTASGAKIVVSLGDYAGYGLRSVIGIPERVAIYGPLHLGGHSRMFVFLPHPNARKKRTCADCLTLDESQRLHAFLKVTGDDQC